MKKLRVLPLDFSSVLEPIHPHKLRWHTGNHTYQVLGHLPTAFHSMEITLTIRSKANDRRQWVRVDLFQYPVIEKLISDLSCSLQSSEDVLRSELLTLTALLEDWRDQRWQEAERDIAPVKSSTLVSPGIVKSSQALANSSQFLDDLDNCLTQAGIIAPSPIRQLLWIAGATYKSQHPQHISVKSQPNPCHHDLISHLQNCFPPEDSLSVTRITAKSLYHYRSSQLRNKVIWLHHPESMDRQAQHAISQLQQHQKLTTSTAQKDQNGGQQAQLKTVETHFSSYNLTQQPNPNHLYIDLSATSPVQWQHKIQHQLSGTHHHHQEHQAQGVLQQYLRQLSPLEVYHPYAQNGLLIFQEEAHYELDFLLHTLARQLAFLQQAQRPRNDHGQIVTQAEDLYSALALLWQTGHITHHQLTQAQQQTYQRLKDHLAQRPQPQHQGFRAKEIQHALRLNRSAFYRQLNQFLNAGLVTRGTGDPHNGHVYHLSPNTTQHPRYQQLQARLKARIQTHHQTPKTPVKHLTNTQVPDKKALKVVF